MAALELILPELRALDDAPGDVLVVAAFSDERPLEGLAGLVDWRLCGALSRWRIGGFSTGELGEQVLYPTGRRLSHPRLLFVGLGRRDDYRPDRAFAVARATRDAIVRLGAERLTTGLFGLDRLPSPLERTALKLVELLSEPPSLQRITLVADLATQGRIKDGIHIFGTSPD
ncbi:MAG: hypothetical protein EP329_18155 [Deltaproteobacteria bacterium]|nr:MAG: hypothetical protein EP329_18155 [Deltaproteobacteria bacterium]